MNVHDKFRTPCPICGKRYSDLRQHIRLVHEGHKVNQLSFSHVCMSKQLTRHSPTTIDTRKMLSGSDIF